MSILIKGINPPSCCKSCQLIAWNNDAGFYCAALSDNLVKCACSMDGSKRGDCPLVEIPEPHGRLIDADKLEDKLSDKLETDGDLFMFLVITDHMPTVIEAEGARAWMKKTQETLETLAEICEELHKIRDILEMMMEEQEHE